jgi:hypothetical protein
VSVQSGGLSPQAVLVYVEQMLIELASMTNKAGSPDLALRMEALAAETGLQAKFLPLTSQRPDRPPAN